MPKVPPLWKPKTQNEFLGSSWGSSTVESTASTSTAAEATTAVRSSVAVVATQVNALNLK